MHEILKAKTVVEHFFLRLFIELNLEYCYTTGSKNVSLACLVSNVFNDDLLHYKMFLKNLFPVDYVFQLLS